MSRLFGGGEPIRVWRLNGGLPKRFQWNERIHFVQQVANSWRVDVGWWRLRVWRDYYKLLTTSGLLVIVYHDLLTDAWYLYQLFD